MSITNEIPVNVFCSYSVCEFNVDTDIRLSEQMECLNYTGPN